MPKYTNNGELSVSLNGVILKAGETRDFPYYVYKENVDMEEYDEESTIPQNLFEGSGLHELSTGESVDIDIFDLDDDDLVIPVANPTDTIEFHVLCDAGEVKIFFNNNEEEFITLEAGQEEYGNIHVANVGKITVEAVDDSIVRFYVLCIN
jgi:hypothetical protein